MLIVLCFSLAVPSMGPGHVLQQFLWNCVDKIYFYCGAVFTDSVFVTRPILTPCKQGITLPDSRDEIIRADSQHRPHGPLAVFLEFLYYFLVYI